MVVARWKLFHVWSLVRPQEGGKRFPVGVSMVCCQLGAGWVFAFVCAAQTLPK